MNAFRSRSLATLLLIALTATAARADTVTIAWSTVGNPGNPHDATGYGAVDDVYEIGTYDVTIGQYTAFLNAVAKTDTYSLYNASMGTNLNIAGISRSGSSGSYVYSVMNNGGASSANRPITYVSWFDAARFANWIANGQPTGAQDGSTTENGAYDLSGVSSGNAPAKNDTNPNTGEAPATWIPSENEWYKAAYYEPTASGGPSDGYWAYATRSDAAPGNIPGSGANQANYPIGAGYSVTQANVFSSGQNYLTDVGTYTNSASYYGTFDQSGNVYQWIDAMGSSGSDRILRGGYWSSYYNPFEVSSGMRPSVSAAVEDSHIGFRLAGLAPASVPEIDPAGMGSVLALIGGGLGLLERRRKRA